MLDPVVIVALVGALASIVTTWISAKVRAETKSPNGTRTGRAVIETRDHVERMAVTLADLATAYAHHAGDDKRHGRATDQPRQARGAAKEATG